MEHIENIITLSKLFGAYLTFGNALIYFSDRKMLKEGLSLKKHKEICEFEKNECWQNRIYTYLTFPATAIARKLHAKY